MADFSHKIKLLLIQRKNPLNNFNRFSLARGQGFEPRLAGPKPAVLPLDDPRLFYLRLFQYTKLISPH